jgi:hypothetical protein
MTINLQPVPARQVAPPPRSGVAVRSSLGDTPAALDSAAAYDQGVQTIVLVGGTLLFCAFILYRDTKRGFYSGKSSKAITTDEAITRLVAIGGAYYFLRQTFGKTALTPL